MEMSLSWLIPKDATPRRKAMRVSTVSLAANITLSLAKAAAGVLGHSAAMVSDAVHSASDAFSTLIVMAAVHVSSKDADPEHQYGHERLESVASIILAVVLFLTAAGIGLSGARTIISGNYQALPVPGVMALVAAAVSILVKEWMYWFTRITAQDIRSGALMADAWHHRSDSLSSLGALIGIAASRMGFPFMDAVASMVISALIIKAAFSIFRAAVDQMVDKSCAPETINEMQTVVLEQTGVLRIDSLRTRLFGPRIFVDIEIAVDAEASLQQSHAVAENVHDAIEDTFPDVKHCMVHVNPSQESTS